MYQIQATYAGETTVWAEEFSEALDALPKACDLTNLGYKVEIVGKHEAGWMD